MFVDEFRKLFSAMGASSEEQVKLAAYQLKDISQSWYEQLKSERQRGMGPISWEVFGGFPLQVGPPITEGKKVSRVHEP